MKPRRPITTKSKYNDNKHNMELFYKIWKKYNEIQSTINKMDLNNRKMKNHPPSHVTPLTNMPSKTNGKAARWIPMILSHSGRLFFYQVEMSFPISHFNARQACTRTLLIR